MTDSYSRELLYYIKERRQKKKRLFQLLMINLDQEHHKSLFRLFLSIESNLLTALKSEAVVGFFMAQC